MKPYFQEDGIVIYHGDCREVLPSLERVDMIITDPPYPDIEKGFTQTSIRFLDKHPCRQLVFWSAIEPFPLSFSAVHIWHKPNGRSNEHYERIFERNGQRVCRVWRESAINSCVVADMTGDVYTNHPTQKPIRLIRKLLTLTKPTHVLDPFMGSGTTLRAAKDCGLKAIGIEIEERYCEIAANRLRQGVLSFVTNHERKAGAAA